MQVQLFFLLLGGFILAQGFEKSQLHRRIALKTLLEFGKTRKRIIFIIMFPQHFLVCGCPIQQHVY